MKESADITSTDTLRQALFTPRTVALVGASADAAKLASRPQRVLRRHGFTGHVIPINPGRSEIGGEKAYPDLRAVPEPIDHAFIMVPAAAVPGVVAACCEVRIPAVTIFTAGFAELGDEGRRRQEEMVAAARRAGVRLLGPNCLGVVNVTGRIMLSANAVLEREQLRPGALSVVSQSGSMLGAIITRAQERGLGFSKLVSVGNECDLAVGELVDMLVDDPDTRAILLFLEAFRDGERLGLAARRAFAAGKPVIAFKLGRSAVGRAVATSHTGAITGPDDLANAFFQAHGIMRVEVFEALFEIPQLVLGHRPPAGRRAAVLTVTGGAAAMVVDRLGLYGVEVVRPTLRVIENLAGKGIAISDAPLTDLPMGRAEGGVYTAIADELLASDHCDAVVAVQGSTASFYPESVQERVLAAKLGSKPLAVFLGPKADEALRLLQEGGVAGFRTPESCADAVNAYLNWRAPAPEEPCPVGDLADAEALAAASKGARLNEYEACALFAALSIARAENRVVTNSAQTVDMGFPVAVKLLSPDIPHKSDAGMVVLKVESEGNLRSTVQRMLNQARQRFPQARIDGVLVQRMQRGLAEVIVGYRRDPEVGPVVLLGMGGVMAELKRSYCVRIAPVNLATAASMIEEVPELAILRGFRNLPRGDCAALARAIRAMSLLACLTSRTVIEAEINPLIVKGDGSGVVAVDGLVVFE